MKLKRIMIVAVVILAATVTSGFAFGWALVNAKISHDFPDVPRISTDELAAWLADPSRPAPLLLDVRTLAEFEISHLAAAQHVEPDAPAEVVQQKKEQPIVTYCSVGYRSSVFARKLRAAGFTNVWNLEGSIFKWANDGRAVFRNDERVEQVHPYNSTWGLLLARKYRARVASH